MNDKKYICKLPWKNVTNLKFGTKKVFSAKKIEPETLFYFKVEFKILNMETFIVGMGKKIEDAEQEAWESHNEQLIGGANSLVKFI